MEAQNHYLRSKLRKHSLAWDVIFYQKHNNPITVAVTVTDHEISSWARSQKREFGFTKWISIPFIEFNHRYKGQFDIVAIPSWGLIRKPEQ